MTVTSQELRSAATDLHRTANVVQGIVERHQRASRQVGEAVGRIPSVWRSPAAERLSSDASLLVTTGDTIASATARAGEHLQSLSAFASNLAEEVAGYERARMLAVGREQDAQRRLSMTDPTDTARITQLTAEAREARQAINRADEDLAAAAQRWTVRSRSIGEGVANATHQLQSLHAPSLGPVVGPVMGPPAPPTGVGAATEASRSAQDWVTMGWEWGAAPGLTLFHERQRNFVFHLEGRTTPGPTTQRALHRDVVRRGHWRNPPRVSPNSPLYGQPRPQVWVSPVIGPTQTRQVAAPPAPAIRTRDVATRVPLPQESWSRGTRLLGPVGNVATVGISGFEEYQRVSERDDLTTTQQVANVTATAGIEGGATVAAGMGGAKGGALGGAALGTLIFPGVGTAIGAGIGAVGGGLGGGWLGNKAGGKLSDGLKKLNPFNAFGD